DWKAVKSTAVCGLAGAAAGAWAAGYIDVKWLGRGFGVFLILLGIRAMVLYFKQPGPGQGVAGKSNDGKAAKQHAKTRRGDDPPA
nr:TSUP family transporter [bacterium]